jgi:hypothetical protein
MDPRLQDGEEHYAVDEVEDRLDRVMVVFPQRPVANNELANRSDTPDEAQRLDNG